MNFGYEILVKYLEPFTSPFYLLSLVIITGFVYKKSPRVFFKLGVPIFFTVLFWTGFEIAAKSHDCARWLYRLNNPIFAVISLIAVPAIFLPRNRYYRFFLILPACAIVLALVEIVSYYNNSTVKGFHWFIIRPGFLIAALVGFLVIAQYFLSVAQFRTVTRITVIVVLLYGGFAFRQSYTDYQSMLARRQTRSKDIMLITETTPVMRNDNRLVYIPAAPCRFSADGGYVQGCVMELSQRIMQVNYDKIMKNDPSEVSLLAVALAALVSLTVLTYIGARWWCGWICPLSAIGEFFNFVRKSVGLSYIKPARSLKIAAFSSGIALSGFAMNLAYLYTRIDADGKFMGCKIPLYPFCKICPGQQICPVASLGQGPYFALPGMEWLFGFFRIMIIVLLSFFILGYMTTRRIFCRFCPMGMYGALFNRGALLALKKEVRKCNGCGICNEVCPMDIHVVQEEMKRDDVSDFNCVYCLKCVDNCPQDKCLRFEFAGKKIIESNFTEKM